MNTKSHIKRVLTLALYVGILSAVFLSATAGAAVISINIESQKTGEVYSPRYGDITGSYVTGTDTEWNVLEAGDSDGYAYAATTGVLGTMDGSVTQNDVKFTIVGSEGKVGRLWAQQDYIFCQDGGSNLIDAYEFSYTGLIAGQSYDILFKCNRNYSQITIDGVTEVPIFSTNMLTFNGAIADESGVITGDLRENTNPSVTNVNDKLYWMQIKGEFDLMKGTPSGGVEVEPANPLTLSWMNLAPNVGSDVYVDVWYGTDPTDPNAFSMIIDSNSVPANGLNLTSLGVDASGNPQMYYWRVDSYINGLNNFNDANRIEGPLYNFLAKSDKAPEDVDAGPDWITWVDEAVALSGTYTDDGYSAVTVTWSSSDPNAVFIPSDDGGVTSWHPTPTVSFDNAAGSVTLTFAVQDEGNDPVSDTMTIDVYNDVCAAGVAARLSTIFPGDLNADCVTNIDDLLIMAQSWLVDTQLTEAVAK